MPAQTRSSAKKAETPNAFKPTSISKNVKPKPGKDITQMLGDVGKRYNESDSQGRENIDGQYLVNGKPPNVEPSGGQRPEPPNSQPPTAEPPNGEPPTVEPPNGQPPNVEPSGGQSPEPPDCQPPNTEPANVQKTLDELHASLASHKDPDVQKELHAYLASHKEPDLKMEDTGESLFVEQDPEDVFTIVGSDLYSHHESAENEESMGYFVGPFGRVYEIVRKGIIGRFKYVARGALQTSDDLESGIYSRCGKRILTKDKKNQKIQSLQGVAWEYNEYEKSYLQSIVPKTWTKEKSREVSEVNERRRPPALKIKVKWQDGETSWETRTVVKKHWPRSGVNGPRYKVTIEEPVTYKDLIILDVGDIIENADLAMVKTAIRCEKNYADYVKERENTPQIESGSIN